MRVVHVITRLIAGGAQENTVASVLGMQDRPGLEASLITGPPSPGEGSLLGAFSNSPHLVSVLPSLIRPVHPWHDLRACVQLTRRFRQLRPDLVHTHSGKAGVLGRWAARRAAVPLLVHTIHGPSFGPFQGPLPNALFRAAERSAGKITTHFVSVAQAMTRQYLAAGIGQPHQYTRIFSGFPLRPFLEARNEAALRKQLGLALDDIVVGKIARFYKLKGYDDLMAIAPALLRRCPRLKFLLVGGGPDEHRFQTQARSLGLAGRFIFTGLVPPEQVPKLLGVMDLVVHFSRREGLARSLSQALCAGRPVVACNCDGADEVCLDGETGFLVPPGALDQYEARVLELAKDPALRKRLGERGQAFVREHFAIEKMLDELWALYRRLRP